VVYEYHEAYMKISFDELGNRTKILPKLCDILC